MRMIALLCICVPVAAVGHFYVRDRRSRSGALRELTETFGSLRISLNPCFGAWREVFCGNVYGNGRNDPLAVHFAENCKALPVGEAWRASLETWPGARYLHTAEKKCLADFASAFSARSLQAFQARCVSYESLCGEWLSSAQAQSKKYDRVGAAFAVLLSALIFIVLC